VPSARSRSPGLPVQRRRTGGRAQRSSSLPLTPPASRWLAQAGTPADQLDTSATVTFVPGTGITKIALQVRGTVPGLDEDAFVAAAQDAKVGCPVSKALAAVPEITLDAALA
jgi:OsmC-like protein